MRSAPCSHLFQRGVGMQSFAGGINPAFGNSLASANMI